MHINDIPAGPIGTSRRWDKEWDSATERRHYIEDQGWRAGYSGEAYPKAHEADVIYAKGYANGLIARVEDAAA